MSRCCTALLLVLQATCLYSMVDYASLDQNPYLMSYNIIGDNSSTSVLQPGSTGNWKKVVKITNSLAIRRVIPTWPASWQYPVLLGTVADEHFIRSVQLFYESMLMQDFESQDLFILCTTFACSKELTKLQIPHYLSYHYDCHDKIKCLISDGKFAAIAYILQLKISFLFVDLDVYFKSFSFEQLHPTAQLDIMVQNNRNIWGYHDLYNFGLFLVRPTDDMIHLFEHLLEVYRKDTSIWDQKIFNDPFYTMKPTQHQFFNESEFYLFGFPEFHSFKSEKIHAIHMVCIEGEITKLLFALEYFGPFTYPSLYDVSGKKAIKTRPEVTSPKTTITIKFKTEYTRDELVGLIGIAVKLWKTFPTAVQAHTYIRLVGWDYYHKVLALYNPDILIEENISLVESSFWHHVQLYMNKHHPTLPPVVLRNTTLTIKDLDSVKNWNANNLHHHHSNHTNNEDIFLSVHNKSVLSLPWSMQDAEKYLCKYYDSKKMNCLGSCNGSKHFRDHNFSRSTNSSKH